MARHKGRLLTSEMFLRSDTITVSVNMNRHTHSALAYALRATGEPYAEDAIKALLVGAAAPDNMSLFMLDERARLLISTFRSVLLSAAQEATEIFTLSSEQRLNEFINLIHSTEETQ